MTFLLSNSDVISYMVDVTRYINTNFIFLPLKHHNLSSRNPNGVFLVSKESLKNEEHFHDGGKVNKSLDHQENFCYKHVLQAEFLYLEKSSLTFNFHMLNHAIDHENYKKKRKIKHQLYQINNNIHNQIN